MRAHKSRKGPVIGTLWKTDNQTNKQKMHQRASPLFEISYENHSNSPGLETLQSFKTYMFMNFVFCEMIKYPI